MPGRAAAGVVVACFVASLAAQSTPVITQAAVANAINDTATAERLARTILRTEPHSDAANAAYDILSKIYIRTGQYKRFSDTYREWSSAFPTSAEVLFEKANEEKFRGRPNQVSGPRRRSLLRHGADELSLPVSVNGKPGEYLFDTGAWQSAMTELEARRLGLTIRDGNRTTTDSSGAAVSFRTAVASEVVIGSMHFRDVSFAVFAAPEWAPDAAFGIIGMPILLQLGTIKWSGDGALELGATAPVRTGPNLVFNGHRLLLKTGVLGKEALLTFDTGASTTDLNANFADRFPDLMAREGQKGTQEINGIGGTHQFDAFSLPELRFLIDAKEVVLRPAHVTLQRIGVIGGDCCVGNAGQDLLKQSQSFLIDFTTMTLQLK